MFQFLTIITTNFTNVICYLVQIILVVIIIFFLELIGLSCINHCGQGTFFILLSTILFIFFLLKLFNNLVLLLLLLLLLKSIFFRFSLRFFNSRFFHKNAFNISFCQRIELVAKRALLVHLINKQDELQICFRFSIICFLTLLVQLISFQFCYSI